MPDRATLKIHPSTRSRLKKLKPFSSVSYDELLADMADVYTGEKPRPRRGQAATEPAESGDESADAREQIKTTPGGPAHDARRN